MMQTKEKTYPATPVMTYEPHVLEPQGIEKCDEVRHQLFFLVTIPGSI
jgi:hypothetical protein